MVRAGLHTQGRLKGANARYQLNNQWVFRAASTAGTMVAALRHMKTKLNLAFAFAFGLLASLALPSGAAEVIVSAVAWVEDLHIAEFAVAANALTIVP